MLLFGNKPFVLASLALLAPVLVCSTPVTPPATPVVKIRTLPPSSPTTSPSPHTSPPPTAALIVPTASPEVTPTANVTFTPPPATTATLAPLGLVAVSPASIGASPTFAPAETLIPTVTPLPTVAPSTATFTPQPVVTSTYTQIPTSKPSPTPPPTVTPHPPPDDCTAIVASTRPPDPIDRGDECWLKLSTGGPAELIFNASAQITYATLTGGDDRFFFVAQKGDSLSNITGATIRPMPHIDRKFGNLEALKRYKIATAARLKAVRQPVCGTTMMRISH